MTFTADPEQVDKPCCHKVDGRRRHVSSVHGPDQLGQAKLPLNIRLLLRTQCSQNGLSSNLLSPGSSDKCLTS